MGRVWVAKNARKMKKGQLLITIKKPLSIKQSSLISSTSRIQRSKKGRYAHISMQCGPIFYRTKGMFNKEYSKTRLKPET